MESNHVFTTICLFATVFKNSILLTSIILSHQTAQGSGQFELQIVKVDNPGNRLLSGGCCGAQPSVSSAAGFYTSTVGSAAGSDTSSVGSAANRAEHSTVCRQQCATAVTLCLREWSAEGSRRRRTAALDASFHPMLSVPSVRVGW